MRVRVHPNLQSDSADYFAIMARGLPYDVTKNEVAEFFSDCRIKNGKDGIHILIGPDGRLQGDAVIELEAQEDLDSAKQLHNQMLGRRYIEISSVSRAVADHALANQPGVSVVSVCVCACVCCACVRLCVWYLCVCVRVCMCVRALFII